MNNLDHLFGDDLKGYSLVDLSQIALATAMVTYEQGTKFNPSEVRHMILSTIRHNVAKFKTEGFDNIVICVDNAKYGYWRRQFADYYKRNRAISREENKNDFDWDGYFEGLWVTISELKEFMPYIVMDIKFAEADDIIGVLTRHLSNKGHKVRIISSDGDFTQLHKYVNVDQWSPIQKKFVKIKTGSPEEDCLTKILKGDKKDCVASVKVKGDFYLCDIDRNTPQTSAEFVTSLVGKSVDEIREVFVEDIANKYAQVKGGKKWIETDLLKFVPDIDIKQEFEDNSREDLMERVFKLRIIDQLTVLYGKDVDEMTKLMESSTVNDLVEYLADMRIERFKENQVLIDFDYIRDDIKESIIDKFENSKPNPRGKMYGYFVRNSLTKLLPDINSF